MHVKFVSDLDYSLNKSTGKYDIPAVQWENDFGTYWELYDSEEARDLALTQNEAYNNSPEVKAFLSSMQEEEDKHIAKMCTSELFDYALDSNSKVELMQAINFSYSLSNSVIQHISKLVCEHNKRVILTQFIPAPATNRIGDFL